MREASLPLPSLFPSHPLLLREVIASGQILILVRCHAQDLENLFAWCSAGVFSSRAARLVQIYNIPIEHV